MKKIDPQKTNTQYAYFITFVTYGSWMHFDDRGSVDPKNNIYGTPRIEGDRNFCEMKKNKMRYAPFMLNTEQRINVMQTVISVCNYCEWRLFAVNVRTNHIHIVVQSQNTPEYVMNKIKAYASRHLNILNPENKERSYWARHGSTIPVLSRDYFYFLMDYVVNQQGSKIACHYEKWFDRFHETGCIPIND
ncbi:MAG: transposase [Gammaproteobacteria bacterium]|nr:transposase [Gammaproteobacteria bacterium]